ncbi:hypothetical protein AGDE_13618 [Angomonas deanei]|uniref:Uncharacterized protein n=1 Tax=Angomonas deanei TaxID=59799 RepID=A0A7G2C6L9_9TRYP|nr:hypothetical protein AGDE_13618 [Angomonas deanei]CAD2215219.1 hypothetical protein, conserved [Angomonas deanei]|eukprot:EPY22007.1 hypothetical protein AGDE_13618 [Angomonas deanei]
MKIFQCFENNAITLQLGNSPILYLTIQHWMAAYQQNRHNCIQFQKETIFEIPINNNENNNKLILFRHPFARLRSKENVSLFSQILKRLNKNNLDFYYAQYFQPVLFSEPLACIDRLLLLSVGYDNSFLNLYTKLLKKESPCFFVFLFQHALQSYALKYAESESFVSSNPNFQNISKIIIITNFIVAAYLEHIRYRIKLLSTEPQLFHVIEKENETKFQILTNGVSYLFRVVEFYLRSEKRSHVLVGTELLKSMLYYFKNYSCEHLLNWSETQISSFYHFRNSRRVMTNFNVCRFRENMLNDSLLFSDVFVFGHFALETHFNKKINNENENFSVPKEYLEDDEEDVIAHHEKNKNNNISLSIGERILLHLLRQQFKIYKNQSDLDTTEHNIINIHTIIIIH